MRRREFLGAGLTGTAVSLAGCVGGDVVLSVEEGVRIPARRGWYQEIDGVDGSGEVGYTIRSEQDRFEVFYFTEEEDFETYQEFTLGDEDEDDSVFHGRPTGHDELSSIAMESDNGVYQAQVPEDGSRYSIDIEGTHFLVVDHSDYGQVPVKNTAAELYATVSIEVVDSHLW